MYRAISIDLGRASQRRSMLCANNSVVALESYRFPNDSDDAIMFTIGTFSRKSYGRTFGACGF